MPVVCCRRDGPSTFWNVPSTQQAAIGVEASDLPAEHAAKVDRYNPTFAG
jgi:hypothetical protein